MNQQGLFIASLLDAAPRAYANGAVERQVRAEADTVKVFSRAALIEDTEMRIRHLAEALAADRPALMQVGWLKTSYAARGVDPAHLRRNLEALREELVTSLPDAARDRVAAVIDDALVRFDAAPSEVEKDLRDDSPLARLARRFLVAAVDADRRGALEVIAGALDDGVTAIDLYRDVIAATQAEVGRMWQTGDISVGDEHLVSRTTEDALALIRLKAPLQPTNGRSVLVGSVRGNQHDLGARMVADALELAGWRSIFLGANMPTDDLLATLERFSPDVLAVSVHLALQVRAAADLIAAVRARPAFAGLPIMAGGPPFQLVADLWEVVGADATAADLADTSTVAERLAAG